MNQVSTNFRKPIPPTSSWWTNPNRVTWRMQATQTEWPRMRVVPDRRIRETTIGWHGVIGPRT